MLRQHRCNSAPCCRVCGRKSIDAAPSPGSKRSRASPQTDGKLFEPRGCAIYNVCKWSRELGNHTAEAYLPKGGQKESAGGEEEGAMPSARDGTRRGRSSRGPCLADGSNQGRGDRTPSGHHARHIHPEASARQQSECQTRGGSITFTGRGSLQSPAICDDVTNTYSRNGRKKLVHLTVLHSSCVPAHPWPLHAPWGFGVKGRKKNREEKEKGEKEEKKHGRKKTRVRGKKTGGGDKNGGGKKPNTPHTTPLLT